mmetsp:Transcript_28929/g.92467  ORF Transcript_28929/g.92467 Transcript_28929/m.92467 type:complete len:337 (-) Transcript_28929:492-1502(-)
MANSRRRITWGLGGLGARGGLQRPHGGLQGEQDALPRGPALLRQGGDEGRRRAGLRERHGGWRNGQGGGEEGREDAQERPGRRAQAAHRAQGAHRGLGGGAGAHPLAGHGQARLAHAAARLQPHVPDAGRRHERRVVHGVPAPGDGAGHLRELQDHAGRGAHEAALRHRADRQGLPQRNHAAQLHLPQPRVRADGGGVLHPAGGRRLAGAPPGLDRLQLELAHEHRPARGPHGQGRAQGRRARALRARLHGHHVQVPLRRVGAAGRGRPRQLRPHSALRGERQEPGVLRRGEQAQVRAARHRAVHRRRAPLPRRGLLGLRRGRGRRGEALGDALHA